MVAIPITLGANERIVRIYARFPKQTNSYATLLAKDFARKMGEENGISLLRVGPNFLTQTQALAYMPTNKKKGLAGCDASALQALGLIFMANSTTDPHFTVRCPSCNLNPLPRPVVCHPNTSNSCSLDLQATPSLAQVLLPLFIVDVPIV